LKKSNRAIFFVILVLICGLVYVTFNGIDFNMGDKNVKLFGANQMRYGIDIRGGVEAIYQPKEIDYKPSASELETAKSIFETRLDSLNITDREITINQENGYILVRFPWKSDETDFNPEKAISELGETANLTFRDEDGNILLTGARVTKATAEFQGMQSDSPFVVVLQFDNEGAKQFADATEANLGKIINIYMDETLISFPRVQTVITGGSAIITGSQTMNDAKDLANKINSGSLPFSLVSKSHSTISPTLGEGALNMMIQAGIIAFILICIFLIAYYRMLGVVACISLVLQVIGMLLALSVPQFSLTLPGISALILSIGLGVDANIIVSERIIEELNTGKSLKSSIESGFHKAFSSVFDGNITNVIAAIILIIFGSGALLSFGYSLIAGVVMNFVAGITVSRLLIKSLSCFKIFQKPFLFGAKKDRSKVKPVKIIHFYKNRFKIYIVSLVVFVIGIIFAFINGVNLDIQFKGGVIIKYTYVGEINAEQVEKTATDVLGRICNVQKTQDVLSDTTKLVINLADNEGISSNDQQLLSDKLKEVYENNDLELSESWVVEPFIGAQFIRNSIIAVIISFILMVLYVWYSFRKIGGLSAGVMAIMALLHDSLVVLIAFIVFKIPLNDSFLAAVLSILGLSVNSTIIIYDRIRENMTLSKGKPDMEELVDRSISQTLTRTVNTNIALFVSIGAICIFAQLYGLTSVQSFALPMLMGLFSGAYTSICVAGPCWVMWLKHKQKKSAALKATK